MKKAILITGCSTGIGYRAAQMLQQRGYRVFATCRRMQDVERLQQQGLESWQLDVDSSASIDNTIAKIKEINQGQLYALFNNAGFGQPGAVEDLSREALRQQFETNFFGASELANKIMPLMRQQGHGRIIINSSLLGYVSMAYRGAYNATKYALEGLFDTMRIELLNTDIQIAIIAPGPITSRFRANAHKKFLENINREQSVHHAIYADVVHRLEQDNAHEPPFTLPPDAVVKKLIHALEAKKAKPRYYVTFPAYLFAYLRRGLSFVLLHKFLRWTMEKELKN